MSAYSPGPLDMEITVVSAEGLKKPSRSIFSKPPRPFITLTTATSSAPFVARKYGGEKDRVGLNWGDKFRVPVSSSFFTDLNACIHLQLYKRSFTRGWTQLGWCLIPATDVGSPPMDSVKYLSYRLRARDGSRSDGIINLAVKVGGPLDADEKWPSDNGRAIVTSPLGGSSDAHEKWSSNNGGAETSRTVIGIPAKYFQFPMM